MTVRIATTALSSPKVSVEHGRQREEARPFHAQQSHLASLLAAALVSARLAARYQVAQAPNLEKFT